MVISGLVFQCDPTRIEAIAAELAAMPELSDVTPGGEPGYLAAVLEAPSTEASVHTLHRLRSIPGVYAVMPTYIHAVEEDGKCSSPAVLS